MDKQMHWSASLWVALQGSIRAIKSPSLQYLLLPSTDSKLPRAISGIAFRSLIPCNPEGAASKSDSVSQASDKLNSKKLLLLKVSKMTERKRSLLPQPNCVSYLPCRLDVLSLSQNFSPRFFTYHTPLNR